MAQAGTHVAKAVQKRAHPSVVAASSPQTECRSMAPSRLACFSCEGLAKGTRQRVERVGFEHQFEPVLPLLDHDRVVAAGEHHRQAGVAPAHLQAQLDSVHARHDHVGKHQLKAGAVCAQQLERRRGAGGPDRAVA